jgi:hypothetical protein
MYHHVRRTGLIRALAEPGRWVKAFDAGRGDGEGAGYFLPVGHDSLASLPRVGEGAGGKGKDEESAILVGVRTCIETILGCLMLLVRDREVWMSHHVAKTLHARYYSTHREQDTA